MKIKWRFLKILVTVIILGFLLSFSLKRFSEQKMRDQNIVVTLAKTERPVYFIREAEIVDLVKKMNPSKKIGGVDVPALEKKIRNLPAVDSANVYLNLNGKINIDIFQRIPAFRLKYGEKDIYVDRNGVEFPLSCNYSFPCMLVTGDIPNTDYPALAELVEKIDADPFCRTYFVGISKNHRGYNLLTGEGNYKVEIGDLDNIDFKVKGFKTFVEKFLVYQDPAKYSKISVKYDNQIVTTLNPAFKENDSILNLAAEEFQKNAQHKTATASAIAVPVKKTETASAKKPEKKAEAKPRETARSASKKEAAKKPEKPAATKKKETKKITGEEKKKKK